MSGPLLAPLTRAELAELDDTLKRSLSAAPGPLPAAWGYELSNLIGDVARASRAAALRDRLERNR